VRSEILDAAKATLKSGFGGSHCLCHGDLGNVEFLAIAAARFGDVRLRRDVAQIAAGVMQGIDERGWRCGTFREVETPGYLTGLAGIGDGLLRVAETRLPSVLMLEPPSSPGVRVPRGRRRAERLAGDGVRAAVAVLEEHGEQDEDCRGAGGGHEPDLEPVVRDGAFDAIEIDDEARQV
jgi:hypothetical protein